MVDIKVDYEEDLDDTSEVDMINTNQVNEWELLLQMGLVGAENLNSLEMIGRHDFDNIKKWDECSIPPHLHNVAEHLISTRKTSQRDDQSILQEHAQLYPLSPKQELVLTTIKEHYNDISSKQPLHMIIQRTTGTRRSYLIYYIRHALWVLASKRNNPLLTVYPIGIATCNIHTSTMHACLEYQ